jgi:hypothetical protein
VWHGSIDLFVGGFRSGPAFCLLTMERGKEDFGEAEEKKEGGGGRRKKEEVGACGAVRYGVQRGV